MKNVTCLLLSTEEDFTTDYIAHELLRRDVQYLRLNRDKMHEYKISFDITQKMMVIEIDNSSFDISEDQLRSVYYRAPTFLRETFNLNSTPEEQLANSQWMAFFRNLTFFKNAFWVNNPIATFAAENKIYQLRIAEETGFFIPKTVVANFPCFFTTHKGYIIKSIDTALIKYDENHEAFAFTSVLSSEDLRNSDLNIAPVMIQNQLDPKVDYRITIVGERVFASKIVLADKGVVGDWRKYKDKVDFIDCKLPVIIEKQCVELVKKLHLQFGAIDLAYCEDKFYFIEINPTGEWAWLRNTLGQKIDEAICDVLVN